MKKLTLVSAVLLIVALSHTAGTALAEEEATRIDSLSAARSGDAIQVTGTATFVDVPKLVGSDLTGDALVPGVGADLTQLVVSRPNPFGGDLRVTISVSDQPPEPVQGVPEAICYAWGKVSGWRTDQFHAPGSVQPHFRWREATADQRPLPGRMEDGVVEFDVPIKWLGSAAGEEIAVSGVYVSHTDNTVSCTAGSQAANLDTMAANAAYEIPAASVTLGMAPMGTPPSAISLTDSASVQSSGAFTGSLNVAGRPSGTYVVRVRACYGDSNCGETTTTVTI